MMVRNLKRCIAVGIACALLYAAWVLLVYFMRSSAPFESVGASPGVVVAFYLVMGVLGGAIVGVMWPLARQRVAAFGISLLVAFMVTMGALIVLEGTPAEWDPRIWIVVPVMTLAFGLAFGNSLWKAARSDVGS